MEKAFGYLRVSSEGQIDGDGFSRQEKAIMNYAKANDLEIVKIYREEGVSGTLEKRPALAELMVSLEQNGHGVKTVIIERLDRLARDLMVQEAIIKDFQKHGFNLISAIEGPDLCGEDPTRKLVRQILGAISEYDKSMIVLKLRAARDRVKAKTGRCEGRKPYGETEGEQAVIKRIKNMRRNRRGGIPGLSLQAIADRLNSEGIKTKEGAEWVPMQVKRAIDRRAEL